MGKKQTDTCLWVPLSFKFKELENHFNLDDTLVIASKVFCSILLFTFMYQGISPFIRSSASIILLAGLVLPTFCKSPIFWLLISLLNLWHLIPNYFNAANHQFIFVYYSFIFTFATSQSSSDAEEILKKSLKYMFVVFMGLATLHKAFSLFYWNGGLLYDYMIRGSVLK